MSDTAHDNLADATHAPAKGEAIYLPSSHAKAMCTAVMIFLLGLSFLHTVGFLTFLTNRLPMLLVEHEVASVFIAIAIVLAPTLLIPRVRKLLTYATVLLLHLAAACAVIYVDWKSLTVGEIFRPGDMSSLPRSGFMLMTIGVLGLCFCITRRFPFSLGRRIGWFASLAICINFALVILSMWVLVMIALSPFGDGTW